MSNTCNCPGGNCPPGCINGQVNCMDPRCYPNCANCNNKPSSSNWIIITVILVLLGVLLVMAFIVGFDLYKKGKKAAEPKNIIVNKHIHSVKQPIVISSPRVEVPIIRTVDVPRMVQVPSVSQVPAVTRSVTRTVQVPSITRNVVRSAPIQIPSVIKTPEISRSVSTFSQLERFPVDAQMAEPAYENLVSYDGLNLTLDDIPKPSVSARETPCNSR